jgi:NADH-quinone oxidoreductase subunit C
MTDPAVAAILREAVPGASIAELPSVDMPTLVVDRDHLVEVCRTLRDDPSLQFALLLDVVAVDYLPADPRFEVVYHLACVGEAYASGTAAPPRRLRLKVRVSADEPRLPSLVSVYPCANWLEREIFDLFGLSFEGHPDLRRILMPDDWEGHPLRKDAPVQIRKDTSSWSPLQLSAAEFAESIRAQREASTRQAAPATPPESSRG